MNTVLSTCLHPTGRYQTRRVLVDVGRRIAALIADEGRTQARRE